MAPPSSRLSSLLALPFAGLLLAGASCPKRAEPAECARACARLADLLAGERAGRALEPSAGLDPEHARGRANLERCQEDCTREGTPKHVECLLAADDLDGWTACSR